MMTRVEFLGVGGLAGVLKLLKPIDPEKEAPPSLSGMKEFRDGDILRAADLNHNWNIISRRVERLEKEHP